MAAHPLDPLSTTEYQQTAAVLRRDQGVSNAWRFASIELKEPAKIDVKAWSAGDTVPRRSFSVLWNTETNQTYEAVVDLIAGSVESWTHIPDACPNFTIDEYHDVDHALHEHEGVLPPYRSVALPIPHSYCSTSGPTARRLCRSSGVIEAGLGAICGCGGRQTAIRTRIRSPISR